MLPRIAATLRQKHRQGVTFKILEIPPPTINIPTMPSQRFSASLNGLDAAAFGAVSAQLEAWENGGTPWAQISRNIRNETALAPPSFTALLKEFADNLLRPAAVPETAWCQACEKLQFSGSSVPANIRPAKLGRACKFDAFLRFAKTTDSRFKSTLTKYAGVQPITALRKLLELEKLGGKLIFATFNGADSARDPFEGLPRERDAVRTALGLGQAGHDSLEPYLLFTYSSSEPPTLPVHRPSVADAGDFSHFRPVDDETAPFGQTFPIPPNPRGHPAMPEVIHEQITGIRLVFPYEITAS